MGEGAVAAIFPSSLPPLITPFSSTASGGLAPPQYDQRGGLLPAFRAGGSEKCEQVSATTEKGEKRMAESSPSNRVRTIFRPRRRGDGGGNQWAGRRGGVHAQHRRIVFAQHRGIVRARHRGIKLHVPTHESWGAIHRQAWTGTARDAPARRRPFRRRTTPPSVGRPPSKHEPPACARPPDLPLPLRPSTPSWANKSASRRTGDLPRGRRSTNKSPSPALAFLSPPPSPSLSCGTKVGGERKAGNIRRDDDAHPPLAAAA